MIFPVQCSLVVEPVLDIFQSIDPASTAWMPRVLLLLLAAAYVLRCALSLRSASAWMSRVLLLLLAAADAVCVFCVATVILTAMHLTLHRC